jgi:exopolysaccharide biosynthesis polyprenyl glycosylphosphotransferase
MRGALGLTVRGPRRRIEAADSMEPARFERPSGAPDLRLTDQVVDPVVPRAAPPLRRLLVAADLFVVALGWAAAMATAHAVGDVTFGPLTAAGQTALILLAGPLLLSASGLYRRRICAIRAAELARIGRTTAGLTMAAVVLLASVGREAAVLAGVVGGGTWFVLLAIQRGLFREWIHGRRATGDFGAPVVVAGGASDSVLRTAEFLAENPVLGFHIRGVVGPPSLDGQGSPFRWLGEMSDLPELHRSAAASGVVLDANSLTGQQLNEAVQELTAQNLHVHISSGLRGVDRRRITVAPLADETFLHVAPPALSRAQVVAKRFVDVAVGAPALLLVSPLLAVCALIIWLQDRGPVLFRQERVGLEGERFTLYKLRTMVIDADERLAALQSENGRSGPLFKLARDPRVTPFGRFLRATSIDELPQLFNVLEGTMSLVGPRPALPSEVEQFDPRLSARLTVKPGVTGLWQVEARDLPNFDLYRRFDLHYVQNWSLALDVAIILRTVTVVGLRSLRALTPTRRRRSTVLE